MKSTSREGYEYIKPQLSPLHEQIIVNMRKLKQTVFNNELGERIANNAGNYYQISKLMPQFNIETVRKRLNELVKMEVLKEVGTNKGESKVRCTVYQLTDEWI